MGVIKRQGIKNSLVSYFGVLIGAVNVLFIYPISDATLEAYGLVRFLVDTSFLLMPFVMLGMGSLTVRFYPVFRDDEKSHHGFLFNLLLGAGAGMLLFALSFWLFKNQIIEIFSGKALIEKFLFFIIPFTCLIGLIELLTSYISNFHRIVVPAVLNLFIKIALPTLVLFYYFQKIEIGWVVKGVLFNYFLVAVLFFVYLKHLGQLKLKPDFGFLKKDLLKEMRSYAGYGILGLLGIMLATRIDTFMVGTMLGELDTGKYGILLFIASVIEIPRIALTKITSPIIADSFKNEDMEHVNELYKKSSLNLLIMGGLLFLFIFTNLTDLFEIMPGGEKFLPYYWVAFSIALAKIVDMATSINNQIIGFSKFFRFNFYAILFMAFFNVVANLIFIPKFEVLGAALATLLSITLYNLVKSFYVFRKFKMHPFTKETIWVVVLSIVTFAIATFVPSFGNLYLEIIARSILVLSIFGGAVFYFKLSPDINDLATGFLHKIFKKPE